LDRRRFLKTLAVTAAIPSLSAQSRANDARIGPLRPDPGHILDLPEGYSYTVVSRAGERMSDGLVVPHAHDGMAAFPGEDGRIILVCNHELTPGNYEHGAFGTAFEDLPGDIRARVYDAGKGSTPGTGGTTTTIYDPQAREVVDQHLSLAGTELNCAGGPTPWGSWLSCEEVFKTPGTGLSAGRIVTREKSHGYVFEVPASHKGLVEPVPIKAMGKFEHEAAAVDESTGIVYMTEDRHHSLFYRYIPNAPGKLAEGGRLQALAVVDRPAFRTHNWSGTPDIVPGESMRTRWIELDNVDPSDNDLRLRGAAAGAATFARGEGLCAADGRFAFTCTIGGAARLGQIFAYTPSPFEGTANEAEAPGNLELIAESSGESLLRNADNLVLAPWGDLIVCEDTSDHCGLVGIRPDGSHYQLADNAYSNSELAGICFSPDGRTMFVNVQYPGTTLAITGPFPT
jgi:secreted PhoX family phosphatase